MTDVALIDDVVDALAAGDRAAVFEAVDRMVEAGHDPRRFATDLLQRLRDLTLLQAVPEAPARGLVDAAEDELARMAEQAGKLGPATLTRYGEILHAGLTEMRGATAPRLLLELLCARMLLPAAAASEPALLERIERMERRVAIAPGAASPPPPAPPADAPEEPRPAARRAVRPEPAKESAPRMEPAAVERAAAAPAPPASPPAPPASPPAPPAAPPPRQEPAAAGALDAAAVRRVWPEVLAAAKQRSRSTEALLVNATVRAIDGDQLLLTIESAPLARRLSEQRNTDVIAEALHAVLGVRWRVRCEHGGADAPAPTNPRSAAPPQPPPPARRPRTPPARRQPDAEDGVPLPPEPPPDEAPPDDEESMIAEAAEARAEPTVRRDPEEVAIELLSSQLGARTIER